ncbi:hypothetical protein FORC54_3414 [Vibrio vulnificus]|nr:hypothetical protein FORC54_3414 [Vibrio vulnificus]
MSRLKSELFNKTAFITALLIEVVGLLHTICYTLMLLDWWIYSHNCQQCVTEGSIK